MSGHVTFTLDGDAASAAPVAVIVIDNPPVNALGPGVVDGLQAALDQVDRNASIRAVVVMGAGRTFVAGADIKELEDAAWGEARVRRTSTICLRASRIAPSRS